MDIVVWLRSLGLGKYEAAFRENDIDETVLPTSQWSSVANGLFLGVFLQYETILNDQCSD